LEGQVHCLMFIGFSHCNILRNISVRMDSRIPFRPWIYVVAIFVSVVRLYEMSISDCQAFHIEAVASVRHFYSHVFVTVRDGKCKLWSWAFLRRSPAPAWLLPWRVRIPPSAWIFLCCVGSDLCDGLNTRSVELCVLVLYDL
jgi:hypothetical protein